VASALLITTLSARSEDAVHDAGRPFPIDGVLGKLFATFLWEQDFALRLLAE